MSQAGTTPDLEKLLRAHRTRMSNWAIICLFACILSLLASIKSCAVQQETRAAVLTVAQLLERLTVKVVEARR